MNELVPKPISYDHYTNIKKTKEIVRAQRANGCAANIWERKNKNTLR